MPDLSVIIPAYNREHLIGETIRSLLKQTIPAKEIIVVDDGSTDGTAQVAKAFGEPVKVICQRNGGPAAARNAGFRASTGEYIHFFDSDDLAAPNKHEVQLAALESSGADIAYGPWVRGVFKNDLFFAGNHVMQQHGLPCGSSLVRALLTNWSIMPHAALFRRSIVSAVCGFPEDLFVAEDQHMFLTCLLLGAKVVHTPGTIEFYRDGDPGKITHAPEWSIRRIREWARFLLKARATCLEKGIDPLEWFGFRRRAWEAEQDLRNADASETAIVEKLKPLFSGTPSWRYAVHRKLERWYGGAQWRLTGGRAHPAFRMGLIVDSQRGFLKQLGYRLASD